MLNKLRVSIHQYIFDDKEQRSKSVTKRKNDSTQLSEKKITWSPPREIKNTLTAIIPLNKEMLPDIIYKFSEEQALRLDNAPIEFSAVSIIVSATALIGNCCTISPKENDKAWEVSQALWGLIVSEPSTLKTPSAMVGINLIEFAQQNVIDLNNLTNTNELLKNPNKNHEIPLANRKLLINDATPEALLLRLKSNPNGILQYRDEIYGLLNKLESNENAQERSIYTEAFAGLGSYEQERIARGTTTVKSMFVGLLGCIQPDRIRPILEGRDNGKSNDGFFERFQLIVFPDAQDKYIDIIPDDKLNEKLKNIFCCLAGLSENQLKMKANYSKEAQELWNIWAINHKKKTISAESKMKSPLGKHPSLVAKLSLVFHLFAEAEAHDSWETFLPNNTVQVDSLNKAIKFSELLLSHNKRIQDYIFPSKKLTTVKSVLNKIKCFTEPFTLRELQRKGWKGMKNSEQCKEVLEILIQNNYIRIINSKTTAGKDLNLYQVNPTY